MITGLAFWTMCETPFWTVMWSLGYSDVMWDIVSIEQAASSSLVVGLCRPTGHK
jgi:hypothetical protein